MQTIRSVVSDITNELNSYRLDDRISYRYIKNRLFDAAAIFIKQDAENRRLYKLSELWSKPQCFELETVQFSDCSSCNSIKRSKKKVQSTYQTGFGNTLKVFNSNMSGEYNNTTPSSYTNISNRAFKPKVGYYWLSDDYIYVPDNDEIDEILVVGIFKEGLDTTDEEGTCKKPLDFMFSFPDYIISLAKTQVITDIVSKHIQIPVDERPDDNKNQKQ